MVILGIDPGYALMGWGVIEANGMRMRLIDYGCIETKAGEPMQHRLRALQLGVKQLVETYHPDDVAFEELFFARNVTTALMVGAARGAAIISAATMATPAARWCIRCSAGAITRSPSAALATKLPSPTKYTSPSIWDSSAPRSAREMARSSVMRLKSPFSTRNKALYT